MLSASDLEFILVIVGKQRDSVAFRSSIPYEFIQHLDDLEDRVKKALAEIRKAESEWS